MYYAENKEFLDLFKIRFQELNAVLIQPWIKECIEKLSSLPLNSNNSNESI